MQKIKRTLLFWACFISQCAFAEVDLQVNVHASDKKVEFVFRNASANDVLILNPCTIQSKMPLFSKVKIEDAQGKLIDFRALKYLQNDQGVLSFHIDESVAYRAEDLKPNLLLKAQAYHSCVVESSGIVNYLLAMNQRYSKTKITSHRGYTLNFFVSLVFSDEKQMRSEIKLYANPIGMLFKDNAWQLSNE